MKVKNLFRIMLGAGFFVFSGLSVSAQPYRDPIRVIAVADVHQLRYDKYSVREFLDVYNDDYNSTLLINAITADTWRGHQLHMINENWLDGRRIIEVPPGKVVRVAERKRIVSGRPKRNWWVRWIRYTIITNRGLYTSNFVASPFKNPEKLEAYLHQRHIDSLTEPGELTPHQKIEKEKGE
ncbi:MAG: hypothetical protein Kow0029_23210 [Candidatus Rifleibacteriota bacterium]